MRIGLPGSTIAYLIYGRVGSTALDTLRCLISMGSVSLTAFLRPSFVMSPPKSTLEKKGCYFSLSMVPLAPRRFDGSMTISLSIMSRHCGSISIVVGHSISRLLILGKTV